MCFPISFLTLTLKWKTSKASPKRVSRCCCYHISTSYVHAYALLKYGNIGYAKHRLIFSYFCLILGPTRALCPVRSTTDGDCCIFPFAYQGKEHNYCTSVDSQGLGCQTSSVNKQGQMYGTCNCKWCRYNVNRVIALFPRSFIYLLFSSS